ncbi:MAG: hypothetical protein WC728_06655 [Elusimicrobiota bacterium]
MKSVLIALLACRAFCAQATAPALQPEAEAIALLDGALGVEGTDILDKAGYIVLANHDAQGRHLLYAQWSALSTLEEHAAGLAALASAYETVRNGGEPGPGLRLDAVHAIQELPSGGLLTPAVKGAIDLLSLHLAARLSLDRSRSASAAAAPDLLYDKSWAKGFFSRTHGATLDDFSPLSQYYFRTRLVVPGEEPEPVRHLVSHLIDVHGKDVASLVEKDRVQGQISDELGNWTAKYLLEQKLLWILSRTSPRLRALERGSLRQDMRDLGRVAAGLAAPDIVDRLKKVLQAPAAPSAVRISGTEISVQNSKGGKDLLEGEAASMSLAYVLEGLPKGGKAPVFEVGFLDPGDGPITHPSRGSAQRENGGYGFSSGWPCSVGTGVYRILLHTPGSPTLRREASVSVAGGARDDVEKLTQTLVQEAACRLASARSSAADAVEDFVKPGEAAGSKELGKLVTRLADRISDESRTLEELQESLPGVLLYASQEQCRFRTDRAERGLDLLERLPPGCDVWKTPSDRMISDELFKATRATARRRLNQDGFLAASAKARDRERACDFKEAARLFAAGMALLDSDPVAKCGEWEKEYTRVRLEDLPRVVNASGFKDSLERSLQDASKAFAGGDPGRSLSILTALIGGVDSLPEGSCYASQKEAAEKLAQAAGVSLGPTRREVIQASLEEDPIASEAESIREEYRRRKEQTDMTLEQEASRQAPTLLSEEE